MKWGGPIAVVVMFLIFFGIADVGFQTVFLVRDALRAQARIASALEKIVGIKYQDLKEAEINKMSVPFHHGTKQETDFDEICRKEFSRKDVFWNGIGCSKEVPGCAHGTGVCHQ